MPIKIYDRHPKEIGWHRVPDPIGQGYAPRMRASGKRERFHPADPRMDPLQCHHTQFMDSDLERGLVHCLECGHMVNVSRDWSVVSDADPLSDADLVQKRREHNDFWFDKRYKINPGDPDDPQKDKLVLDELKTKGLTKL